MTGKETRLIAQIMTTADGGCPVCAAALFRNFSSIFPGKEKTLDEVWGTRNDEEPSHDWAGDDL